MGRVREILGRELVSERRACQVLGQPRATQRRPAGLKVPQKQPKRGRLWLNDGSCVRLRPESKEHVWTYDFVHACTREGRPLRLLTLIDEFTRECLAIVVARRLESPDV